MADPTDIRPDADANVIDVTSFTSQIQGSLQADLIPDMQAVADLANDFRDNLVDASSSLNLKITGDMQIEKMQQSLAASDQSLTTMSKLAKGFRSDLSQASDLTEARHILLGEQYSIQDTIKKLTEDQQKLEISINDDLVEKVKQEQAKLDLLPEGVSGYQAQEDALKQAQDNLADANVEMAAFTGQILAANKYNDTFLAGQEEMLKNATTLSQYQFDVRQSVGAVVQESNALLKVNEGLNKELELYGDNMKNFMENYGGMVDDVMGGFDKIGDSITGTLEQIPLIGGLLSKYASGPLGEAADIAKNAFGGALKESFKIMQNGGSVTDAIAGGMSSFVNGLQGLGSALGKLLNGPFLLITAIAGLLFLAFKRFGELEEGARDFRKEVGGTLDAVRPIVDEVQRVNVEFAHMGVSLDDGFKAASALTEKFGTFGLKVMPGAIETVALLSTQLGVADANAAGAMEKFRMMGAAAGDTTNNLMMATASAANLAGVNADEVMADIAGASEDALIFMGETPGALAAAAIKAKQLGTNINDVASTMESMLDFESSINKEMELSSFLGRHISMDKMRQAAFAGDEVTVMEEQKRLLKEMGGLQGKNPILQKKIAESLGTSVENLMKMEQTEKDQAAFKAKYGDEAIALEKELEALRGGETKDAADRMKQQMQEQVQQEKMNRMKNEFNAMMVKLGEKLLPMIEVGMAILVPILSTIFDIIGYILYPFELLGMAIDYIATALKPVVDWMGEVGNALGIVGDGGDVVMKVIGSIIGGFLIFKYMIKPIMKLFTGGIVDAFKKIWEAITTASGKVGELLKNVAGGVGDALKKIGSAIGDVATSIGKGIAGLAKGIGDGIAAIFKGIGDGIKALVNSLKNLSAKKMLKAATALLILAGAMWVSAKAFQEFAKVSWDGVMKGSTALGVMTTALIAMSKLMKRNTKTILKGVGIIALLGIAIIPAAEAFKMFAGIDWESVFYGVGALAAFGIAAGLIGALAAKVALGALVIALLGVSMIPLVYGFQQFTNTIDWAQVWIGLGAMTAFAVVVGLLGAAIKFIALGALAIALLGVALIPLAYGFEQLVAVDWTNVWVALGATAAFAGVAALLGFASPLIIAGSIALGILGLALVAFGTGLDAILPAVGGFVGLFGSFTESLSKLSMDSVFTLGALGLTMAGFALLLPAVAAGAVTVAIMSWSIGKLGDAAEEAAPGINALAEGLSPVIDKMLMISEASEKMRDASSVIRDVAGAMASLGAGQAAQAAGGVMASAGGLLSGGLDFASDALFGTENVEKNKEGPIDKMIRLAESVGNLQGIEGTLQGVRNAVESFTDVDAGGLASLGSGIRMLVFELGSIDTSSLIYLQSIKTCISGMMDAVARITEESTHPLKSMLACISNPDVFSVAVAGFDSLTESIIKFGEALDKISLLKLAMLGLVSKTDEAEKKLSEQPEIAEVVSKTEGSASVPTPTSEVAQTTTSPTQSITQQQDAVDLAQKGYIFSNFVEKIGGEDRLQQLQAANDKIDELSDKIVNLAKQGVTQADPLDPDSKLTFATQGEDQQFQKLNREIETARADRFKMRMEMTNDATQGLSNSNKALTAGTFNRKLDRSLFDLDLIQEKEAENRLLEGNVSPVTQTNVALSQSVTEGIESTQSNAGAGFELPSPATAPSVTETLATVNQPTAQAPAATTGTTTDMSTTEANLAELIGLMKSGGIAVYLDSKKVSKGLAAAAED